MDQENFRNWKEYVSAKYKIAKKDNDGNPVKIRDLHWMNFRWGDDGNGEMVQHPNEVWFRNSFSTYTHGRRLK